MKEVGNMHTPEEICKALNIDYNQIVNIYPYGSQVYGCNTTESDEDFVIVYKSAFLPSGAFKDNAISSEDRKIQGTCYSRTGFLNAIRTYEINALECIFLPDEKIIQKKMNFKLDVIKKDDLIKKIIETSSNSYFHAIKHKNDAEPDMNYIKKNLYHAIRILNFGIQIKKHNIITNYGVCNELKKEISETPFKFNRWTKEYMKLTAYMKFNEK